MPRRLRLLALTLTLALAAAASAVAATRHGVTPVAPTGGSSVPAGKAPAFRVRASGPGQVWIRVCKKNKTNRAGVICAKESIGRAKKKDGAFEYKPRVHDYSGFWLNSPGAYYWQAYRIACNASDCRQEGPIVRFQVR